MVMQDINLKRFVTLSIDLKEDEYKAGLSKYSNEDFIEYFLEMQKEDIATGEEDIENTEYPDELDDENINSESDF